MDRERLKNGIAIFIAACIFVGFITSIMMWAAKRDAEATRWLEAYEKCVKIEYETTPSRWYWEHGEYPMCNVRPYW